jgi:hypothetical protein
MQVNPAFVQQTKHCNTTLSLFQNQVSSSIHHLWKPYRMPLKCDAASAIYAVLFLVSKTWKTAGEGFD